jgi:hypothetical protein
MLLSKEAYLINQLMLAIRLKILHHRICQDFLTIYRLLMVLLVYLQDYLLKTTSFSSEQTCYFGLPDLSRILNDPIFHSPYWPVIPAKLPSNIPKFDGRSGEDPNNHVMTFHLWCSSNSFMDESIRLRLFQ